MSINPQIDPQKHEMPKIEKFHPIPRVGGAHAKYPWRHMQVGSDFLYRCELDQESLRKAWNSLTSCKAHATKNYGFKFRMRKVPGGIRVWRVA